METEEYKGYTIKIEPDEDPINPRTEWDNLGTMAAFHNRYDLGDKLESHGIDTELFGGWDEIEEHIRKKLKGFIILPLYLYDHGGITMNTTGFSCNWDSGQVGFIYITAEKIRKEFSKQRISASLKKKITDNLRAEVKLYDQYLTGDVWGISAILDPDGDEVDDGSVWGFFGTEDCVAEAKSTIEWDIKVKKELKKVNDTPKKRLPLLIGALKYEVSKERLQERLQEIKNGHRTASPETG